MKLANGNTVNAQVIGIILCRLTNCPIIYDLGSVYYCPFHPSNTLSLGSLKCYVGFKNDMTEPLEHYDFLEPQGCSCISLYSTQKHLDYLHI